MPVSASGPARHEQISNYYRDLIQGGDLAPGAKLPGQREIAATWECAPGTAARAMRTLLQLGLVTASKGGTFVSDAAKRERGNIVDDLGIDDARRAALLYEDPDGVLNAELTADALQDGTQMATVNTFTQADLVPAPERVADILGLSESDEVVKRFRYRRSTRGVPVLMAESWHPGSHAYTNPRHLQLTDVPGGFTHTLEAMGKRLAAVVERVSADLANEDQAEFYELDRPAAIIVKDHIWYTTDGEPWSYGRGWHRPDLWSEYHADLE